MKESGDSESVKGEEAEKTVEAGLISGVSPPLLPRYPRDTRYILWEDLLLFGFGKESDTVFIQL